jgi:hypothetical protein
LSAHICTVDKDTPKKPAEFQKSTLALAYRVSGEHRQNGHNNEQQRNGNGEKTVRTERKKRPLTQRALQKTFTIVEKSGETHTKAKIVDFWLENGDFVAKFAKSSGQIIPVDFRGSEVTDLFRDGLSVGLSWKPKRRRVKTDRHITAAVLSGLFGE